MKYVIDLPENFDKGWIMADMPIAIRNDSADYMRRRILLEPYKPESEPEPEVFEVGDEVIDSAGRLAYVLVPDYEENAIIVLMKDYVFPQWQHKANWKKTGKRNDEIRRSIRLASEALNEVDEDDKS